MHKRHANGGIIDAKPIAFMLSSDRYTNSNLVELLMERLYWARVGF